MGVEDQGSSNECIRHAAIHQIFSSQRLTYIYNILKVFYYNYYKKSRVKKICNTSINLYLIYLKILKNSTPNDEFDTSWA